MKKLIFSEPASKDYFKKELKMNVVSVSVTHDCNYFCHYCYDYGFRKQFKGKFIDLNGFKVFLENFKKFTDNQDVQFTLMGGEPTLHPNFIELLNILDSFEMVKIIKIVTNASFNAEFIDKIESDKVEFNVSYHHGNNLGLAHYTDLFEYIKSKNKPIKCRYMLDNKESLSEQIQQKEILNNLVETKFDSLFGVTYSEEFLTYLKSYSEENNEFLRLYYDDGSEELINYSDVKNGTNPYKGMYCGALFSKFALNVNFHMQILCRKDTNINALNYSEFRKLKKQLYLNKCNLDRCVFYMFFKKSINQIKEL